MKALIVYDSVYGNTEKIARAVAGAIAKPGEVKVLRVGEADPSALGKVDLLMVGSPTRAWRPTPAIQEFLRRMPENSLKNINVAAFDTRATGFVAKLFGNAASRIADGLKAKGGTPVVQPEGFIVKGKEGPLEDGETERAAGWAKAILQGKK